MFGRQKEISLLEEMYKKSGSQIVVIYGRRRIGKSYLVNTFCENKPSLTFEGLEREPTSEQIKHFTFHLKRQIKNQLLQSAQFKDWNEIFSYLNSYFEERKKKEKIVIFFDELPWMAASQTKLIGLLKYYWDNFWKKRFSCFQFPVVTHLKKPSFVRLVLTE